MTKLTIEQWMNSDKVSQEYKNQINMMTPEQLEEAFHKNVEFGTAGMRGLMGLGTNRINEFTIARAALAFAQFVNSRNFNKRVAIAYDNRNNSKKFAEICANVLATQNIEVFIYDKVMATPLLSYAVRELNCGGGINITASHNPKEYNGFKVYNEAGCQLITSLANQVVENVNQIEDYLNIETQANPEQANLIKHIDNALIDKYRNEVLAQQLDYVKNAEFSLVYSPQHGAGINVIPALLDQAGYNYSLVESQSNIDGDFSNTLSPNPEDTDAYIEGIKLAKENNADIVVTTDPDADRLGVAVRHDGEFRLLNGNETTAIILNYIFEKRVKSNSLPKTPFVANTIVTSDLGDKIANKYNATMHKTLTGFKYLGTLIDEADNLDNFIFAYEESYGSLPLPLVRDKDAVSATLFLAEIAAHAKLEGKTLIDVLEEVYAEFGYHVDQQESITVAGLDGAEKVAAIMNKFYSETLGQNDFGNIIKIENYDTQESITSNAVNHLDFEKATVFKVFFEELGWIAVRPSGTEPKIKVYYAAIGESQELAENHFKILSDYIKYKIDWRWENE